MPLGASSASHHQRHTLRRQASLTPALSLPGPSPGRWLSRRVFSTFPRGEFRRADALVSQSLSCSGQTSFHSLPERRQDGGACLPGRARWLPPSVQMCSKWKWDKIAKAESLAPIPASRLWPGPVGQSLSRAKRLELALLGMQASPRSLFVFRVGYGTSGVHWSPVFKGRAMSVSQFWTVKWKRHTDESHGWIIPESSDGSESVSF